MGLSAYRGMWLVAMFDLPTDSAAARKAYARFRKALLNDGFMMLQYSVYARYCASEEASEVHRQRVAGVLPPEGEVRLATLTDRQFGKMQVFVGKKEREPENAPQQLELF
jgi:CRISPR-associated protein Cas2